MVKRTSIRFHKKFIKFSAIFRGFHRSWHIIQCSMAIVFSNLWCIFCSGYCSVNKCCFIKLRNSIVSPCSIRTGRHRWFFKSLLMIITNWARWIIFDRFSRFCLFLFFRIIEKFWNLGNSRVVKVLKKDKIRIILTSLAAS